MPRIMVTGQTLPKFAVILTFFLGLAPTAGYTTNRVELGYDEKTRLVVQRGPVYPEGVAYDSVGKRFLIGSARFGHLFAVDSTGELTQLSSDDRLTTILGIKVDVPRNRVLAAVTDYGVSVRTKPEQRNNLAAVAAIDLRTGRLMELHDMTDLIPGPAHLANDVAVDTLGNVYVTDSLAHAIYKIDVDGKKSVLVQTEQFKGEGFTLNGLVVHPNGFLLVAKKSDGKLFKVPLNAPEKVIEVKLPQPITAADGILLAGEDLVVIRNRTATVVANEIVVLSSIDGWTSATIASRKPHPDNYPTTATLRGHEIMTVASHLNALTSILKEKPSGMRQEFQIHSIGTVRENYQTE